MSNEMDLYVTGHILLNKLNLVSNLSVQIEEFLVAAELGNLPNTCLRRIIVSGVA